jgi:hypothetical protein
LQKIPNKSLHLFQEKLRKTIGQLQGLAVAVRRLALFSGNETADDVPTASLRFLLVPGYLAYALTDLNVPIEKRAAHLRAAKVFILGLYL